MPDNKDMMNNSEQHSDCDYKQSNITTDKSKKLENFSTRTISA